VTCKYLSDLLVDSLGGFRGSVLISAKIPANHQLDPVNCISAANLALYLPHNAFPHNNDNLSCMPVPVYYYRINLKYNLLAIAFTTTRVSPRCTRWSASRIDLTIMIDKTFMYET